MGNFEKDIVPVDDGQVTITCIGHGTLMLEYNGTVIHVDPVSTEADYSMLPKADVILITHDHYDHLDLEAMKQIRKEDTEDTPEMRKLSDIHVAFLPVNQPYTMTTLQAVAAAKAFKPNILYPYHYGDTNVGEIAEGLKDERDIEVRIRSLQ